jgi:uncharacterized protein (DUF697 family)/tellurite resistance protein
MMQEQDREPVIAICLLAALADGERTPEEQEHFARITARLGGEDISELVARVQRGELTAAVAAQRLASAESRRSAYEMAVAMVYADGEPNPRERAFLTELQRAMALSDDGVAGLEQDIESLAKAPLSGPTPVATPDPPAREVPRPSQAGIPAVSHDAALEAMIRQQALLAGALELLPQNIASLAIIPIQMRLVYRIGADYGQKLDGTQIRDLLGVLGIGAAGQVLDGVARRILGGLGRGMFGRVLGGVVGGTAGMVAGAGVSFVATYALGHAARQYYAQGRRLSQDDLRQLFERFREEAEALLPKVQQEIHAQSRHLDLGRLLGTLRGSPGVGTG